MVFLSYICTMRTMAWANAATACSRNIPNTEAQNVFREHSEQTPPSVPGNSGNEKGGDGDENAVRHGGPVL